MPTKFLSVYSHIHGHMDTHTNAYDFLVAEADLTLLGPCDSSVLTF